MTLVRNMDVCVCVCMCVHVLWSGIELRENLASCQLPSAQDVNFFHWYPLRSSTLAFTADTRSTIYSMMSPGSGRGRELAGNNYRSPSPETRVFAHRPPSQKSACYIFTQTWMNFILPFYQLPWWDWDLFCVFVYLCVRVCVCVCVRACVCVSTTPVFQGTSSGTKARCLIWGNGLPHEQSIWQTSIICVCVCVC